MNKVHPKIQDAIDDIAMEHLYFSELNLSQKDKDHLVEIFIKHFHDPVYIADVCFCHKPKVSLMLIDLIAKSSGNDEDLNVLKKHMYREIYNYFIDDELRLAIERYEEYGENENQQENRKPR